MTRTTTPATVGDLAELIPDFLRSLRAADEPPLTVDTDGEAARQLLAFLIDAGMPTDADSLQPEHIASFLEHLLATRKPPPPPTATGHWRSFSPTSPSAPLLGAHPRSA